jgi:hypothetical protein
MLHPNQFKVNEAWILFRLNSAPVRTERDGDFNCIALMDAASCLILGTELISMCVEQPTRAQFRRLLQTAQLHKQELPRTLFVPTEDTADPMIREARRWNIDVVRVTEDELMPFIGEARESFANHF